MLTSRCRKTNKVRYSTHTDALVALVEVVFDLEDRHRSTRAKCPCRTYACAACEGWHLTAAPLVAGRRHWVWGWWLTSTANRVVSYQQVSRIPTTDHRHRKAS